VFLFVPLKKGCKNMTITELIDVECQNLAEMLKAKNRAYGNSFADPVRIFSRVTPEEGLNIRIDDKLSRIARGKDAGEDAELDLIGYLILKRVLRRVEV
jgi:hypothetical protein